MYAIQLTIAWASRPSCPALCDRLLCDQRLLIQGEASRERAGAAGGFWGCQPPRSPQVNEKLRPTRRLQLPHLCDCFPVIHTDMRGMLMHQPLGDYRDHEGETEDQAAHCSYRSPTLSDCSARLPRQRGE
jgi:hypothetical protein